MEEKTTKIYDRAALAALCKTLRAAGQRVVFTNGCFDILHAGHVELLQTARHLGDFLIVGLNSDESVRRLKGPSPPVNPEGARAAVLAGLGAVDAVCIFSEDTPIESIESFRPAIHVKGGDYRPDDLPEAAAVRRSGGEIRIVPLVAGFSTTTFAALNESDPAGNFACAIVIPARYGSTRFPGKPLAKLGDKTVIEHVVARALATKAERPIYVATDDARIAAAIENAFDAAQARVVMTSPECATGTDRLAEVARAVFAGDGQDVRRVIVNVQGDEPFIQPRHIDALIEAMRADPSLKMATLATPITDAAQIEDGNVVKVALAENGDALYFSRCSIPFVRDAPAAGDIKKLRHLGVYAYTVKWLLEFAALPPSPLEENEKLEQLRALENGCRIRVVTIDGVVNIAIDTPADLEAAHRYLHENP